ncbi:MAG: M90 family metallopeptidase, partial [Verrucomicrobiota bacterium]
VGGMIHAGKKKARRGELMAGGFTEGQDALVRGQWPMWDRLPAEVRKRVEGLALVFLDEKVFEPCGGVPEVTEEMRFVIAAQACLLWANQRGVPYPKLKAILIYPGAYRSRQRLDEDAEIRLGESWSTGSVVLSWQSVQQGGLNEEDGHNLVMHEFAHQLDTVNGPADGFPQLPKGGDVEEWSEVFQESYEDLLDDVQAGRATVLDDYGTKNEAEFFAVATETFFEKPKQLRREHEPLYEVLAAFFAMRPDEW